jgi:hypothetical protein
VCSIPTSPRGSTIFSTTSILQFTSVLFPPISTSATPPHKPGRISKTSLRSKQPPLLHRYTCSNVSCRKKLNIEITDVVVDVVVLDELAADQRM